MSLPRFLDIQLFSPRRRDLLLNRLQSPARLEMSIQGLFPPQKIDPRNPPGFTTTIHGITCPSPSYHTTKLTSAPDMRSGGTVELIFTLQLILQNSSSEITTPWITPQLTINAKYALSGSLHCDGTELKLADGLQMQYTIKVGWVNPGDPGIYWRVKSVSPVISNSNGTVLDTFNTWATGFIVESFAVNG